MLFLTSSGLLNVFIEPQFMVLGNEPLYTVQSSDLTSLQKLQLLDYAEHRLDLKDSWLPFISYAYLDGIEQLVNQSQLLEIERLCNDFSPEPLSYFWVGQVTDFNSRYSFSGLEHNSGHVIEGYCLAEEIQDEKHFFGYLENFRVYPLYRTPTNHELNSIWISD